MPVKRARRNRQPLLIDIDPNIDVLAAKDNIGNTAFHWAVINNNINAFYRLFRLLKDQIIKEETLIPGKSEEILLTEKINSDAFDNQEGQTPWHLAAQHGYCDFFTRPVEQEAFGYWHILYNQWLNRMDKKGNSLLHLLVTYHHKDLLSKIERKATILKQLLSGPILLMDTKNNEGDSALHVAAAQGCFKTFLILIHSKNYGSQQPPNTTLKNIAGHTALDKAILNGHQTIAKILIKNTENILIHTMKLATAQLDLEDGIFRALLKKCILDNDIDIINIINARINTLTKSHKFRIVVGSTCTILCPAATSTFLIAKPGIFGPVVLPIAVMGIFPLVLLLFILIRYKVNTNGFGKIPAETFYLIWDTVNQTHKMKESALSFSKELGILFQNATSFKEQLLSTIKKNEHSPDRLARELEIYNSLYTQYRSYHNQYKPELKYLTKEGFKKIKRLSNFDPKDHSRWAFFSDRAVGMTSFITEVFCPLGAAISIYYGFIEGILYLTHKKDIFPSPVFREGAELILGLLLLLVLSIILKAVSHDHEGDLQASQKRKLINAYNTRKNIGFFDISKQDREIKILLKEIKIELDQSSRDDLKITVQRGSIQDAATEKTSLLP